jgi:hypothetical protein
MAAAYFRTETDRVMGVLAQVERQLSAVALLPTSSEQMRELIDFSSEDPLQPVVQKALLDQVRVMAAVQALVRCQPRRFCHFLWLCAQLGVTQAHHYNHHHSLPHHLFPSPPLSGEDCCGRPCRKGH